VLSITDTKTIPPCVGKQRLGVSGYERGSYDGHRDEPTRSTKVVVRVTRVIDEIPISRGFSRAISEDIDVSPGFVDFVLLSPVDHGGLSPMPNTS
jgi:hypothetical protein